MSQAAGKKPRGPRLQMNDFASRAAAEGVSGQTDFSTRKEETGTERGETGTEGGQGAVPNHAGSSE